MRETQTIKLIFLSGIACEEGVIRGDDEKLWNALGCHSVSDMFGDFTLAKYKKKKVSDKSLHLYFLWFWTVQNEAESNQKQKERKNKQRLSQFSSVKIREDLLQLEGGETEDDDEGVKCWNNVGKESFFWNPTKNHCVIFVPLLIVVAGGGGGTLKWNWNWIQRQGRNDCLQFDPFRNEWMN